MPTRHDITLPVCDQCFEESALQLAGGDAVRVVLGRGEGDGEVAGEGVECLLHRRSDLVVLVSGKGR